MMKKDILTLWEQEGDLERMKWFFAKMDPDPEQKERIKQLALEKIREEEKRSAELETTAPDESSISADFYKKFEDVSNESQDNPESETFGTRFGARIRRKFKSLGTQRSINSLRTHRLWKVAVPAVAALLLMVVIGQARMNGSFDFSLENMGKSAVFQSAVQSAPGFYDTIAPASPDAKTKGSPPADDSLPRKITYNMDVTLQVEDVNLALERITQEVKRLGGYVVESSQNEYQSNSSAHAFLKVPSSQLEGIRGLLPAVGKVLNQRTTANDITNQYYDAETRLRSWQAQEARYLEILQEAHSVEEILKIEEALGNIRMQIEQLKGQLKFWDHEVSYSTIQLNLQTIPNPVNVTDPWQPVSWSKTWQAAKDAVLKTLSSTWNGLNYLVVGLAYALPYLIVLGVLFGIYKGIKKFRR